MVTQTAAEAIAGYPTGSVAMRWIWQRRTLAGQFIDGLSGPDQGDRQAVLTGTIQSPSGPTLTLDNGNAVLRSLRGLELRERELDALPGGPFSPTTDNIAVVEQRLVNRQWQDFPLGLFRLELGDTRYLRDGEPIIECEGYDLTAVLTRTGPRDTYTVTTGTNYRAAIIAILDALGLVHNLTALATVTPADFMWPPGTSWWEIVRDLAEGVHYRAPWPNLSGRFVWQPVEADPALVTAAVTYTDADEPRMVRGDEPYRRRRKLATLDNRAAVLINNPFHPDYPYLGVWENADATSPVSTANADERTHEIRWDSTPVSTRCAVDSDTADAIAQHYLQRQAMRYETATITTLPDPRRAAHEYLRITLNHPPRFGGAIENNSLWRVASWSRQLVPGGHMTHELERVRPVAITDGSA